MSEPKDHRRHSETKLGPTGEPLSPSEGKKTSARGVALPRMKLRPARLLTSSALKKVSEADVVSAVREKQKSGGDTLSPELAPPTHSSRLRPVQLLKKTPEKSATVAPVAARQAATPETPAAPVAPASASLAAPAQTLPPTAERVESSTAPLLDYAQYDKDTEQWRELENLLRQAYRRTADFLMPLLRSLRGTKIPWRSLATAHPKLVGAVAAVLVAALLWDSSALRGGFSAAGGVITPYLEDVKARAAFHIVDDFSSGVGDWWDDHGLVPEEPGQVRVAGLALHTQTMDLVSYRLDFDAKIQSHSVGWLVRAADRDTYYAFKLTETGKRQKKHQLQRYPVVNGEPDESQKSVVDVPSDLVEEGFNRVSVRLRDNQIVTLINGRGVDYWNDARLPKGGVGFWVEKGDSGIVRKMTVSGNEDFWGLTLYAAFETAGAVEQFVTSLAADPGEVAGQLRKGLGEVSTSDLLN